MDRHTPIWSGVCLLVFCMASIAVAKDLESTADAPQNSAPAEDAEDVAAQASTPSDVLLQFNFSDADWTSVLEWLADKADLSLDLTDEPPGTFNYIDDKQHTVTEAIDVLNGYLLPRGNLLLRRDQFLVVMNTDNPMLPNLIPTVPASSLDNYGDNELLRIVVPVQGFRPADVAEQMASLLGPKGIAAPLDSSNSLILQGFGKSLREAVELLAATKAPPADDELIFRSFPLQYIAATDAERQIQTLFGIGTNPFQASMQRRAEWQRRRSRGDRGGEQSESQPQSPTPLMQNFALNMKVSALRQTNSLLVTATPAAIALVENILETIDAPTPGSANSSFTNNTPVLRVYTVDNADEDDVAETINSVIPGVVINEDGRNNSIHVLATAAEHVQVEELIDVIDSGGVGRGVQVIPLSQSDPATMSDFLSTLFENEDRDDRPVITPSFRNRSLIVRGSSAQVAEIKKALASFEEGGTAGQALAGDSRFRRLPLGSSRDAERVARVVKELLEDDRQFDNRIRIVVPNQTKQEKAQEASDELRRVPLGPAGDQTTRTDSSTIVPIVYEQPAADDPPQPEITNVGQREPDPARPTELDSTVEVTEEESTPSEGERRSQHVTIEVQGEDLLLYSNDNTALDEVADTIRMLVRQMPSRTEWTVFYLRAAPADSTAQTLVQLLQANSMTEAIVGTGPEYGYGDYASQVLRIVPDLRTNALFVSGPKAMVERAERFLRYLDSTEIPESLRDRVPRSIPVRYADVNDVAGIVRELYKDFMVDPLAQAVGRGDRRDDDRQARIAQVLASQSNTQGLRPSGIQLTLAVDEKASALLVSCNDQLFGQIQRLVAQRDEAAKGTQPVMRVLQVESGTSDQVRAVLEGLSGSSETAPIPQRRDDERRRRRDR